MIRNQPDKASAMWMIREIWEKHPKAEAHIREKTEKRFDRWFGEVLANPDDAEWYTSESTFAHDSPYQCIYIGSYFHIYPSGKFYTPFANSNASAREAALDEFFNEVVEEKLSDTDFWVEAGEGDPTDMFLCRNIPNDGDDE